MAEPSVAQALAHGLRAAGVQRIYGLPGEDHLRLLDALDGAGLRYIGARDETAAVIMAATEAQASGVPGVVVVTIAPGLTNALNGIAHAHLDRVPLLVITGQHAPERAPLIVRQLLDNHRLVDGLTRWTATASARIHQVLAKALDTTLAPPCGPVLLELRDDVASQVPRDNAVDWPLLQAHRRTLRVGGQATRAEYDQLAAVRQVLAAAARPALLVGGCPTDPATRAAIVSAAHGLRAPVFTSPSALGCLPLAEPWFAGTFMNGNLERDILGQCDVLVTIGLDARDFFNGPWRYQATVVAVNTAADTQRYAPAQHQVVGDVAAILPALVPAADSVASTWCPLDVAEFRAGVARPFHLTADALTIPTALRAAREILPAEALVAVHAGFGKPITSYLWSAPAPNMYFTAHGLSTMGYALPAANALQLAYPERQAVAFMGDGSLLMRAAEIGVAAQHGVAPIYIAWIDGSLGQIEVKQVRQNLQAVGAALPITSCARVADAFGGVGVDVDTLGDFQAALRAALEQPLPTLIGARVDQTCRPEWYELLRG